MLWTPKWKKEAKLVLKGSKKFVHFKRDLMTEENITNIRARQQDVREALKEKDKKLVKNKCNLLEQECKRSVNGYTRPSWIAENTEAIFVAVAIILGLKAFYVQPFRIPTGSMQPTLNGINGHSLSVDKWPSYAKRMTEYVTHGRGYINLIADKDDQIIGIGEYQSLRFFTKTQIRFQSGRVVSLSASVSAVKDIAKAHGIEFAYRPPENFKAHPG